MLVIPCRLHVMSFPIAPQNVPTGIKKDENVWLTDRIMSNALMKKTRRRYMVDNFTRDRQMLMIMVADAIREILYFQAKSENCFSTNSTKVEQA